MVFFKSHHPKYHWTFLATKCLSEARAKCGSLDSPAHSRSDKKPAELSGKDFHFCLMFLSFNATSLSFCVCLQHLYGTEIWTQLTILPSYNVLPWFFQLYNRIICVSYLMLSSCESVDYFQGICGS